MMPPQTCARKEKSAPSTTCLLHEPKQERAKSSDSQHIALPWPRWRRGSNSSRTAWCNHRNQPVASPNHGPTCGRIRVKGRINSLTSRTNLQYLQPAAELYTVHFRMSSSKGDLVFATHKEPVGKQFFLQATLYRHMFEP